MLRRPGETMSTPPYRCALAYGSWHRGEANIESAPQWSVMPCCTLTCLHWLIDLYIVDLSCSHSSSETKTNGGSLVCQAEFFLQRGGKDRSYESVRKIRRGPASNVPERPFNPKKAERCATIQHCTFWCGKINGLYSASHFVSGLSALLHRTYHGTWGSLHLRF